MSDHGALKNPPGDLESTAGTNTLNNNYLGSTTTPQAAQYNPNIVYTGEALNGGGATQYGGTTQYGGFSSAHGRAPTMSTILPPPARLFRKFGNPGPLGLSAFALTTFVLSLINVNAHDVSTPNVVLGLALGYGGLVQIIAGIWEFAVGNTFGATAFCSYGGFWLSYATILIPGFGIAASYENAANPYEFNHAIGIYLICWFIFTFLMMLCTLKSTIAFFSLFLTLDLAFLMLSIADFRAEHSDSVHFLRAGGAFGLAAAVLAWWNALAGVMNHQNSFFTVPTGAFPWANKGNKPARQTTKDE
ncbi:Meiotically up-regulated protein 86 protein [Saitoella coloradoensis]